LKEVLNLKGKGLHMSAAAVRCSLDDIAVPFVVDVSLDRTRSPEKHSLSTFAGGRFFTAPLEFPGSAAASAAATAATVMPSPTSGVPIDADA
jgi:hypothetical protein